MSSVNIDLAADTILNVMVGQQDENEVREVVFDFSDWYTTYGSGTISLAIQRPKDEWPYEGTLTVDNSTHKATWEISDTDSAYAGVGQIQLSYTVGTAVKKSVVYRFTVYKSLGALGNVITPIQIQTFIDEVTEALEDMQEELNDVKQDLAQITGLSDEAKTALLACFEKVAWIDENGQDYYDALESALYPPAELVSISAVYTQSGTVYETDSLNSLKSDLVVTAHYDNGTTQTVTGYTLSGTLVEGTSTITVSYSGKTTTFNVTVALRRIYKYSEGTLTKVQGSVYNDATYGHGLVVSKTTNAINNRRIFVVDDGDAILYETSNSSSASSFVLTDPPLYPIPVPPSATKCSVAITPNNQYFGISGLNLNNGVYSLDLDDGWQQGSREITFEAGAYSHIILNCKYNSSGTAYQTEPTEMVVTFE